MYIEKISGKKLTTIGIGGECTVFVPEDEKELSEVMKIENLFVIGGGSNVVIPDNSKDLNFVSLKNFRSVRIGSGSLICGGGVKISQILKLQMKEQFSMFEFLAGVPKITVGGAVAQNAGAFGTETVSFLKRLVFINRNGDFEELKDFGFFGYRNSPFPDFGIIYEAEFEFSKCKGVRLMIEDKVKMRLKNHPHFSIKTAGSTFKNPKENFAGFFIDKAGLKGFSVGDISVSSKHANFLINRGNATFGDFCKIVDIVREKVLKLFDVELELELKVPCFNG